MHCAMEAGLPGIAAWGRFGRTKLGQKCKGFQLGIACYPRNWVGDPSPDTSRGTRSETLSDGLERGLSPRIAESEFAEAAAAALSSTPPPTGTPARSAGDETG